MAIEMHLVRKAVLEACGLQYRNQNYYKLPANFSMHPGSVNVSVIDLQLRRREVGADYHGGVVRNLKVKVLSSAEAKECSKTKAKSPHRILIWCELHSRWVFAGKYVQHVKLTHKEAK